MRIENLLLLGPVIAGYLFTAFLEERDCKVFIGDSALRITHFQATLFWINVLFLPFMLHYILRKKTVFHSSVPFLHVVFTLMIVIVFPFVYESIPAISYRWLDLTTPPPLFEKWESRVHMANFLWLSFLLVQVLFLLYAYYALSASRHLK